MFRNNLRTATKLNNLVRASYTTQRTQSKNSYFVAGVAAAAVVTAGAWFWNKNYASTDSPSEFALDPKNFKNFEVESIEKYNHNTSIFRVKFDSPNQKSGLECSSYLLIKGIGKDGKEAIRPYTPINSLDDTGHMDLLIKEYAEGNVSKYVHQLKEGDHLEIKGPFKTLDYKPNSKKHISMIAGGTGITPMIQVLRTIFDNPEDKTTVNLIFANVGEEDILLRDYLNGLEKAHPDRFKSYYFLEKPPTGWKQGTGFVDEKTLKEQLPPPSKDSLVVFCGPPPMMSAITGPKGPNYTQGEVGGLLKKLGYNSDHVFKF